MSFRPTASAGCLSVTDIQTDRARYGNIYRDKTTDNTEEDLKVRNSLNKQQVGLQKLTVRNRPLSGADIIKKKEESR